MKQKLFTRIFIYVLGLIILALGITLNTKTSLGVSPIISVAYCFSQIHSLNFGNTTLIWYCIFILVEIILHSIKIKGRKKLRVIILDLLQLPLTIVFTRFLNIFGSLIPNFATDCANSFLSTIYARLFLLILAIILTGIGAAMSLNMRIIPNPGDGIVQALSDFTGKSVGFIKNIFDIFNVILTCTISLLSVNKVIGIGLGTLIAMLGVGRVIAVFNHFFFNKLNQLLK